MADSRDNIPKDSQQPSDPSRASVGPTALPRPAVDRLITGTLVRHGRERFGFLPTGEWSYFAIVRNERGERTVWSRRLERAFRDSRTQPQPGEAVGIRENGIDPVTVTVRRLNPYGEVVGQQVAETPRGHWVVERRDWFDERAAAAQALRDPRSSRREAVRNHPELAGAYWALDSASKVAQQRIASPAGRQRFLELVRESLAHAAERGESLPLKPSRERATDAQHRDAQRNHGDRAR